MKRPSHVRTTSSVSSMQQGVPKKPPSARKKPESVSASLPRPKSRACVSPSTRLLRALLILSCSTPAPDSEDLDEHTNSPESGSKRESGSAVVRKPKSKASVSPLLPLPFPAHPMFTTGNPSLEMTTWMMARRLRIQLSVPLEFDATKVNASNISETNQNAAN